MSEMIPREIRLVDWSTLGHERERRVPDLWTIKDIADIAGVSEICASQWMSPSAARFIRGEREDGDFPVQVHVGFNEEWRWLSWEVCDWLMENDLWDFTQGGRYQEYAD